MVEVLVKRLSHYPADHDLPQYMSPLVAGLDLRAAIAEPLVIESMHRLLVPTGMKLAIPEGYEAQVRPRSGLALKKGISLPNSPGTIDADYRGELKVILVNLDAKAATIEPGERIAQLIFAPVTQIVWQEISPQDELPETVRQDGGFGHTGEK